jgi:hypothetical protein
MEAFVFIPNEIVLEILGFVPLQTLFKFASTCARYRGLSLLHFHDRYEKFDQRTLINNLEWKKQDSKRKLLCVLSKGEVVFVVKELGYTCSPRELTRVLGEISCVPTITNIMNRVTFSSPQETRTTYKDGLNLAIEKGNLPVVKWLFEQKLVEHNDIEPGSIYPLPKPTQIELAGIVRSFPRPEFVNFFLDVFLPEPSKKRRIRNEKGKKLGPKKQKWNDI